MTDMLPHEEFHEVWWIFSKSEEWGGLRIAHFRKTVDGALILFINNEPPKRIGPRVWDDIQDREGWVKVKQIAIPGRDEVVAAIDARLREIAREIAIDAGFGRMD